MALIRRHFNSVTAENEMKGMSLQPAEGAFIFTNADKIVAFWRQKQIGKSSAPTEKSWLSLRCR